MKYRIIKLGKEQYKVQRQLMLVWFDLDEVTDPRGKSEPIIFSSAEEAEAYVRLGCTFGEVVKEFTV